MPRIDQPDAPTPERPGRTETIRYSIGGEKPRTVEVVNGKGVVPDQRTADSLTAAIDGVTFTTDQEK